MSTEPSTFDDLAEQGWEARWASNPSDEWQSLSFFLVKDNHLVGKPVEGFGKNVEEAKQDAARKAWVEIQSRP